MYTKNKYKPARTCSCLGCRNQRRSMYTGPRNIHSYEVNKSWRKFRSSFKNLALKGEVQDVISKWEDSYNGYVYMGYTD